MTTTPRSTVCASRSIAHSAAPQEWPTSRPSLLASARARSYAASVGAPHTESARRSSQMPGTMALGRCFRPSRPWKASSGWTAMAQSPGTSSLSRLAVPTNVPVVPRPATKWVTRPPVCSRISRPVPW